MLQCHRYGRITGEGRFPDQQFVEDDAETVQVGTAVYRVAQDLFRGDVLRGAHDRVRARQVLAARRVCDAEIGHFHASIVGKQDVVRFDVAMNEAVRVDLFEGGGDLR